MAMKVATTAATTTSIHWPHHPLMPQSPASAVTVAVTNPSSSKRRGLVACEAIGGGLYRPKLYRSRSCDAPRPPRSRIIPRALSANLASFSDDDFSRQIRELALRFQLSDEAQSMEDEMVENRKNSSFEPSFTGRDEIVPANMERIANSVDFPVSLRMIKRKMQWQEGFREVGESAYCSVKKAFSSMVFIIQELHSYTLQMREALYYEDLQGILARVQDEMNASFVWLFQQVFSHTPTLMVYVMILLANYSVHSMASNPAIAATLAAQSCVEDVSVLDDQNLMMNQRFDASVVRTFNLLSSIGKTTSVGGNNGGGGKYKPIASGADDGRFDGSNSNRTIITDGVSSTSFTRGEESVSNQEEVTLWSSFVDEANRMNDVSGDEVLDHETMHQLTSPVDAQIETDDQEEYYKTEQLYQSGLAKDPNSSLLLANYAQFLYLVVQDFDRAEEYFKKATAVEPKDAEALSKYASFLWQVRNDLWAAEETYLEAIDAEPDNSHYAANYAHFLWNTGGEDTCYPLDSTDTDL